MKAVIKEIAYYLPKNILTNEELSKITPYTPEKIFESTGIRTRYISDADETSLDLAVKASEEIVKKHKIDFIIFCTQTPDYFLPTSACVLQEKLKLPTTTGAIDINLGCSGYIYSLNIAKSLVESDLVKNVMIVTGDTITKTLYEKDSSSKLLFGDAATATLVSGESIEKERLYAFTLGSDGSGRENLIIPDGGFRNPIKESSNIESMGVDNNLRTPRNLFMNGAEIFNFTIKTVPPMINSCLERANLKIEQIDYFLFHQANLFMIKYLSKKMKIDSNKVLTNIDQVGNTSSNSIPLLMKMNIDSGTIKPGMKLLTAGFGVGYSWGANIIEI